ncbi:hypothetical protein, partial [Plasmodium yoelii yoelii]
MGNMFFMVTNGEISENKKVFQWCIGIKSFQRKHADIY